MFLLGFKRDKGLFIKRCVRITPFARQLRDNTLLDHILFSQRDGFATRDVVY
jgi:hypothetical protein